MSTVTAHVKTIHKRPYPAISPLRPELSQRGRTVLITGATTGIGFAIARGFAQASAETVIISGRRDEFLKNAVQSLQDEFPKVKFLGERLDVNDIAAADGLWAKLKDSNIVVDVLVLNAFSPSHTMPILQAGVDRIWNDFIGNVRTQLAFTEKFYAQSSKQKFLINVSSRAIHHWYEAVPHIPGYGLTKNAGTALIQQIAKDTAPKDMQIMSFHPVDVLTETTRRVLGAKEGDYPFDDANLAGHFAIWAASSEAEFLHGRFVWAGWDVDEMCTGEFRKLVDGDLQYLKVGVKGL